MTSKKEYNRINLELETTNIELERTKKLLAASNTLAWFSINSATLWHEVRGEIAIIKNLLQILRLYDEKNLHNEIINDVLIKIENTVERILDKDYITGTSNSNETTSTISINELLQNLVSSMQRLDQINDITFQFDLQDDPPPVIKADANLITRVLRIFIENSIQAMMESNHKKLALRTRRNNDNVEITIKDSGRGISDEILQKMFHEPIIIGNDNKRLGIGLLLANIIIQTYNGYIKLNQSGPSGTAFTIYLPTSQTNTE